MSEPDHLTSARADLADLERDHARLADMLTAAHQRLRDARRGTDAELRKASLEAAGLGEAVREVDAELDAAREHLASLEAEHRRADLEAQHDHLTRTLAEHAQRYQAAIIDAADAALAKLADARTAERAARQAHDRLTRVANALGRPAPRAYRPPAPEAIATSRPHALAEDTRLIAAILEGSHPHPVLTGRDRVDVLTERDQRAERAAIKRAQAMWDAQRDIARNEHPHPDEVARVERARAYVRDTPRPEVSA